MRSFLALTLVWQLACAGTVNVFDNDPAITYAGSGWGRTFLDDTATNGRSFSGEYVSNTGVDGSSASLSFTGDSVTLVTTNWPQGGQIKLILDGVVVKTVSSSGTSIQRNVQIVVGDNLPNGQHTVQAVAVLSPGGPLFDVEGFIYHQPDAPPPAPAPAPVAAAVVAASSPPSPSTQTITVSAPPPPPPAIVSVQQQQVVTSSAAPVSIAAATVSAAPPVLTSSATQARFVVVSQLPPSARANATLDAAQAVVGNSNQGAVPQSSDDDSTSPALVPALAATGGVATLCFVGLAGLWFVRRRKQGMEGTVIGSSVVASWANALPPHEGAYEKMPYERAPSLVSDAEPVARDGAWSSFFKR